MPASQARAESQLRAPAPLPPPHPTRAARSSLPPGAGEGGEDPVRWERITDVDAKGKSATLPHLRGLQNGDIATSRIKQASE